MQPDPRLDGMERRYWQPTGEKVMRGKERKTRPGVSRIKGFRNLGHGLGLGIAYTGAVNIIVEERLLGTYPPHHDEPCTDQHGAEQSKPGDRSNRNATSNDRISDA